ncbi:MAG: SRPBCC family protein [Actinomyces sp.]|uniref:SRPBCC family protein n=1 Tax=Actinomyces sp. TaxID=29317 RepID=UPI0026DD7EAA|nr:SRPBCC family protein [Actinomyces sp.]MDO4242562.1 SRPBCC family protein [Actinomyces sp.]
MSHYITWMNASTAETARLRHREIEPEHLLLGLLAQGGAAAALLGRHGVTLARARKAVDELADADLARVGIEVPEGLRPAPLPIGELAAGRARDSIPLSARAEALVKAEHATSMAALVSLTASEHAAASRILEHLGVDLAGLRAQLDTAAREEGGVRSSTPRMTGEYARYGLDRVLSMERFISAPVEQVAALLADPARLAQWAVDGDQVVERLDDGLLERNRTRRGTVLVRWRLEDRGQDRVIWSCTLANGRYDGETRIVRDIELAEAPGGTLVRLHLAHRTVGLLGKFIYRIVWRWTRMGLANTLTAIARAAAED